MTSFWLIAAVITLIFVMLLWLSSRRGAFIARTRQGANDALRDAQLAEIERNVASGQLDDDAAIAMRQEVARAHARSARRGEDGEITEGPSFAMWGIIGVAFVGAVVAYSQFGAPGYPDMGIVKRAEMEHPSQERMLELLADNDALPPAPVLDANTQTILTQLEGAIANHPDVAEGYYHLRVLHYGTGNFAKAQIAQAKYMELQGSDVTSEDYAMLAETMVLSVNGYVSPQAVNAIKQSLKLDPKNDIATYYMGLSLKQDNQFEDAKTVLTSLLSRGIDNPDWIAEVNRQIAEIDGKINLAKGPTADDVASAADMSEEDRAEMIGSMVDGLKGRLAQSGGTPDEWARLIGALRVLGRDEEASAILGEARTKFPDNAAIKALAQ